MHGKCLMDDTIKTLYRQAARNLVRQQDEIMKQAIFRHLGHGSEEADINLESCRIIIRPDGVEEFFYDGRLLIEFYHLTSSVIDNIMEFSRQYRVHV